VEQEKFGERVGKNPKSKCLVVMFALVHPKHLEFQEADFSDGMVNTQSGHLRTTG